MLSALAAAVSLVSFSPYELRSESLCNPLGLDTKAPQLSWKLRANTAQEKNLKQTKFRILVASSPEKLKQEQGDLWDSGIVASDRTYGILYAGTPLTSLQHCWWMVRCWDQANRPSDWSPPAQWSMGLLTPSDWKAKWISICAPIYPQEDSFSGSHWIWSPNDLDFKADAVTRYFRKSFTLQDTNAISGATLHITADDKFTVKVNGSPIASQDHPQDNWRHPATLDIKSLLKTGPNFVEIEATNTSPGPAGLLAKLIIKRRGLEDSVVVTDGSWTVQDSKDSAELPAKALAGYGEQPWGKVAAPELHAATYYRRSFKAVKPVMRATAIVTALGWVDLELNGKPVYQDLFTPGWTDYRKRVCYRTYDVTSSVHSGENAIGAILGEGWYAGYIGWAGERDLYGKDPMVRVQLHVEYLDGTSELIATDDSWRATTGPIVAQSILHGEAYDAREEIPGWSTSSFDDSHWQTPAIGPEIAAKLEAFPSQPVLPYKEVRAKKIWKLREGTYLIDFGQNLAGFGRLSLREERGTKIVIRFGERLTADGRLYTTNLRTARATDIYVCKGDGHEVWTPRFTFHGFQYAEISGLSKAPTKDTLVAVAISTATSEVGWLETSDKMMNQLISNAWWTQKMNFVDVPTDCPQRDERLGWTGDAQAYIRTATYFSDTQQFFNKWLTSLDDGQRPDGQYPTVAPLIVSTDDGGPAWADAGVICPWTTYEVYGDLRLLGRHYPQMKRFVEFNRGRWTKDLLPPDDIFGFDDWLNIDAPTPRAIIAQAYFAGSAHLLGKAAKALGNAEDAAHYEALYRDLRTAFQRAYVLEDGRIKGETQCGYVLALAFDLLDEPAAKKAQQLLVADIEKRGWHLSTGFVGTRDIMNVLSKCGRNDVAFRLLHNTTFPSWGFTIVNGATSIWERWDGWTPEKGYQDPGMNSFAHYAYGSVVGWMFDQIGGIAELSPGYDTISIAPQIDPRLQWAKCRYDSVHGPILVEWKLQGKQLHLHVEVPPNTTASVKVPGKSDLEGGTAQIGSGTYSFNSAFVR